MCLENHIFVVPIFVLLKFDKLLQVASHVLQLGANSSQLFDEVCRHLQRLKLEGCVPENFDGEWEDVSCIKKV